MTSDIALSSNWAITTMKVAEASLTWTVQNFSYNMTKLGERIFSPIFTMDEGDYKWCVDLYPNGESDPDYVGLYLHLKESSEIGGLVKYQFSLLNCKGEIAHQIKWSDLCDIEPGSAWGYEKFIQKSKLTELAVEILPNDTLTILCEVKVSAGESTSTGGSKSPIPVAPYSPELDLSADLFELWKTSNHSDVVIITENKKFLAHKSILSARSSFFYNLLTISSKSDVQIDAIAINDFDYDVMNEVLRYIYSGKVENLKMYAANLLAAANKFHLPGLKILTENSFISRINVLNVSSLLLLAHIHGANKLKEQSIQFIISNLKDVMDTPGYDLLKTSNPSLISEILNKLNIITQKAKEESKRKKRRI